MRSVHRAVAAEAPPTGADARHTEGPVSVELFASRLEAAPGETLHLAVVFDESLTSSFRNDIYPPYKANRETPPVALLVIESQKV